VNGNGRQDEIWAVLAAITERQNRMDARMEAQQAHWEEWRHTAEDLMKTLSYKAVDLTKRADVTEHILEELAHKIVELNERDNRLTRHLEVLSTICDDLIRDKQDRKKRA